MLKRVWELPVGAVFRHRGGSKKYVVLANEPLPPVVAEHEGSTPWEQMDNIKVVVERMPPLEQRTESRLFPF